MKLNPRTFFLAIAVSVSSCFLTTQGRADVTYAMYAVTGSGSAGVGNLSTLYTVDTATAAATKIGDVMVGTTQLSHMTGLDFNPVTGVLYGVTSKSGTTNGGLYTIDRNTGAATLIGTHNLNVPDISFKSNGALYAIDGANNDLWTFNLTTGAPSLIGPLTNTNSANGGIAFNSAGTLYLKSTQDFYTVNQTSGVATLAGLPIINSNSNNALAFSPTTGLAYTIEREGTGATAGTNLYKMDLVNLNNGSVDSIEINAARTFGGINLDGANVPYISALAFGAAPILVPVPEPNGFMTGLLCLGVVAALRRRRRSEV
jgi:hypothetical protein